MINKVEIVCHKGANRQAPENTLAAARLCVEWGVDYVEIDIHTSSDGVLYIFHGPNLQRTTNGSGWIGAYSAAELDLLDAGSWFSPAFSGEKIPRLEPFLRWIKGKARVFFDVKNASARAIGELVQSLGMQEECFFWSSDRAWMESLHAAYPHLALKVNVRTAEDVEAAHRELGARFVETGLEYLTPTLLETCHLLGIKLMVLYAGNDPAIFRQIITAGADLINTDYGDEFLKIARSAGAH